MTPAARLRFWLAVLAAAPRHSDVEAQALRMVDKWIDRVKKERKATNG